MKTFGEEYDAFFRETLRELRLKLEPRHTGPTEILERRTFLRIFERAPKLVGWMIEEPYVKDERLEGRLVVRAYGSLWPVWQLATAFQKRYQSIPTQVLHPADRNSAYL